MRPDSRLEQLALGQAIKAALVTLMILTACAPASAPQATNAALPAYGVASWYGPGFIGRLTANGEVYTARDMTAAHQSLPFDTLVRVTNLANGSSVVVRINDRGPFVKGRIIDLSEAAAEKLDMIAPGTSRVRLELEPARGLGDTLLARRDETLLHYDAVSKHHAPGALVFLASAQAANPVLIRVVANDPARYGDADLLLSPAAYALLGEAVLVVANAR